MFEKINYFSFSFFSHKLISFCLEFSETDADFFFGWIFIFFKSTKKYIFFFESFVTYRRIFFPMGSLDQKLQPVPMRRTGHWMEKKFKLFKYIQRGIIFFPTGIKSFGLFPVNDMQTPPSPWKRADFLLGPKSCAIFRNEWNINFPIFSMFSF